MSFSEKNECTNQCINSSKGFHCFIYHMSLSALDKAGERLTLLAFVFFRYICLHCNGFTSLDNVSQCTLEEKKLTKFSALIGNAFKLIESSCSQNQPMLG